MQDFASAAMVRLLVRAMRAHGLEPPAPPDVPSNKPGREPLGRSQVPLIYKRSVVQAVLQQGGLGTLLQLAQRVDLLAGEPVYIALVHAASLPDLIARWQRLERYVHARHQISVLTQAPQAMELRHHARGGIPEHPLPAESVAVLGVILGASHAMGVRGLQAQVLSPAGALQVHGAAASGQRLTRAEDWNRALVPLRAEPDSNHPVTPPTNPVGHWTLQWEDCNPTAPTTTRPQRPTAHTVDMDLCDALPWPALAHQLARQVLHDPAAAHTVDALARHAGQPSRSLQRALAADGLSCRSIVTEARTRAAARWLLEGPYSLAEIGFACGFADQPHFTREFARHVGMTPARYRQAFANGA
ncbi:MAG: AraC family transcriptional regulator [Acidovorax sp.]|nr:AraC family transcriptional regulator [Acidovorax sp.]